MDIPAVMEDEGEGWKEKNIELQTEKWHD